MSMQRIYLDNASTCFPKPECVLTALNDFYLNNGSSGGRSESHKTFELEEAVSEVREELASLVGSEADDCTVFSQNITMALNTVIKGYLEKGDEVIITPMEHNAVMRPLVSMGITYRKLSADKDGISDPDSLRKLVTTRTKAVIVQAASNINGAMQDISAIARETDKAGLPLIVDTAQGLPYLDFNMERDNISALCFTGHKGLMGLQGSGGMCLKREFAKQLKPLVDGGTGSLSSSLEMPTFFPDRLEAGTQNWGGIIALGEAVRYVKEHLKSIRDHITANQNRLKSRLSEIEGMRVYAASAIIPVVSIIPPDGDVAALSDFLTENEVQVRCGLHCAPEAHKTIGTYPNGTLRMSHSSFTTEEEIDTVIELIRRYVIDKQ